VGSGGGAGAARVYVAREHEVAVRDVLHGTGGLVVSSEPLRTLNVYSRIPQSELHAVVARWLSALPVAVSEGTNRNHVVLHVQANALDAVLEGLVGRPDLYAEIPESFPNLKGQSSVGALRTAATLSDAPPQAPSAPHTAASSARRNGSAPPQAPSTPHTAASSGSGNGNVIVLSPVSCSLSWLEKVIVCLFPFRSSC
jgi:hypothetical protein